MINPKVSVIIPVYNTETYIEETLKCIINQTLKEIEVIVINDGSTDNSLVIINRLTEIDNRIKVYSQQNQGQSVARNLGLKKAVGEYIYFIDSDDLLQTDALELCYKRCKADKLELIFFDSDIFYEAKQKNVTWDYHRTAFFDENIIYNGKELFDKMLDIRAHRASTFLLFISYSYLSRINFSFYPGIIHEDELSTSILFLEACSVGCIKKSFAQRRVRKNSIMTTKYSYHNVECYFIVIAQLLEYAQVKDKRVQKIIDKYVSYTLNPVFQTAFSLPLKDRLKIILIAMRHNYLKYIHAKNMLILLFKNYISPSTKRQRLD